MTNPVYNAWLHSTDKLPKPRPAVTNTARVMEEDLDSARQSISDYQKGWNDSAMGRISADLVNNHAYRMGRADREAWRAANR